MLHAREDYNRIQDPEGKIGEDEPVFLLRAKDKLFIPIVLEYIKKTLELDDYDPEIIFGLSTHLDNAAQWQNAHKDLIKTADVRSS